MRPVRALSLFLLVSCYTYRPLATPAPVAGTAVDVELTDAGMRDLVDNVGAGITHVQGRVLLADSSGLDLSVSGVTNNRGRPTRWNGERLQLAQRYVGTIQERRLAAGGTGLLGGAVAAGLVAVYAIVGGGSSAVGPSGTGAGAGH
jgi:hypothetical protein